MKTKLKPDFSAEDMEYYRELAAAVIDGDPDKKQTVDGLARLAIAAVRKSIPTADRRTLASWFAAMAYVMRTLEATPVRNIGEVVSSAFEGYVIAAAHLAEAYDIEGDDVPEREGSASRPHSAPQASDDDLPTGQYL